MVKEGCGGYYVFSREEYEFLTEQLICLGLGIMEKSAAIKEDLEGYASQCSGDDEMVDRIRGALDKAAVIRNSYEKMAGDLEEILDHSPCRVKDDPKVYTRISVDTYRMLVLACIGYYAEIEWTRGTIIRGDEEENFTKKEG
jgi:hypothetical protein